MKVLADASVIYVNYASIFYVPPSGSRKNKAPCFSGQSTKAFSPPPPRLGVQKNGYKLGGLPLVDNPLPPPPLVDRPLKKGLFFGFP